jgi:hypothetical protein
MLRHAFQAYIANIEALQGLKSWQQVLSETCFCRVAAAGNGHGHRAAASPDHHAQAAKRAGGEPHSPVSPATPSHRYFRDSHFKVCSHPCLAPVIEPTMQNVCVHLDHICPNAAEQTRDTHGVSGVNFVLCETLTENQHHIVLCETLTENQHHIVLCETLTENQ